MPYYIKVTALQAYPREQVAGLSGEKWLAFLDAQYSGAALNHSFTQDVGRKLLSVAYLPENQWQLNQTDSRALIALVRQWIKKHKDIKGV